MKLAWRRANWLHTCIFKQYTNIPRSTPLLYTSIHPQRFALRAVSYLINSRLNRDVETAAHQGRGRIRPHQDQGGSSPSESRTRSRTRSYQGRRRGSSYQDSSYHGRGPRKGNPPVSTTGRKLPVSRLKRRKPRHILCSKMYEIIEFRVRAAQMDLWLIGIPILLMVSN